MFWLVQTCTKLYRRFWYRFLDSAQFLLKNLRSQKLNVLMDKITKPGLDFKLSFDSFWN